MTRERMTREGRDLYDLQEHTRRAMSHKYLRPEEAYQKLTHLSPEELERFKEDPSVIGPLKPGAHLSEKQIGGLVAARSSYNNASEDAHKEVHRANADSQAEALRQKPSNAPEHEGMAAKMNESLQSAPMATHHLSI